MHSAPAVSYPVGRSRFALLLAAVAWLAGVAGVVAWRMQVPASLTESLVVAFAVVAGGAAAFHGWARSPTGTLSWDGADWTWSAAAGAEAGSVQAVLDIQRVMLLRWNAGRVTRWLWLERAMRPSSWDDVRRAVYSRVPKP